MLRHLLFILLCLPAWAALAQGPQPFVLHGRVLDAADSMGAPYVHLWGMQSRVGGTTLVDGTFTLLVTPGDTLRLSSVGYLTKFWIVPANVATIPPPTIMLYREQYNIDEVVVMPGPNMRKDPRTTSPPPPQQNTRTPIFGVAPGGGITFGFDTKAAHIREQQEYIAAWEYEEALKEFVAYRYSQEFIQQFVPLADYQIGPFKDYCRLPDHFVAQSSDYDLAKAIKDCYSSFIRR